MKKMRMQVDTEDGYKTAIMEWTQQRKQGEKT